jgi:hypothetical protein
MTAAIDRTIARMLPWLRVSAGVVVVSTVSGAWTRARAVWRRAMSSTP